MLYRPDQFAQQHLRGVGPRSSTAASPGTRSRPGSRTPMAPSPNGGWSIPQNRNSGWDFAPAYYKQSQQKQAQQASAFNDPNGALRPFSSLSYNPSGFDRPASRDEMKTAVREAKNELADLETRQAKEDRVLQINAEINQLQSDHDEYLQSRAVTRADSRASGTGQSVLQGSAIVGSAAASDRAFASAMFAMPPPRSPPALVRADVRESLSSEGVRLAARSLVSQGRREGLQAKIITLEKEMATGAAPTSIAMAGSTGHPDIGFSGSDDPYGMNSRPATTVCGDCDEGVGRKVCWNKVRGGGGGGGVDFRGRTFLSGTSPW